MSAPGLDSRAKPETSDLHAHKPGPACANIAVAHVHEHDRGHTCSPSPWTHTRAFRVFAVLEKASASLCAPGAHRAMPPQGGYFHGSDHTSCLSICESGFDDQRWLGGKYGIGQYLSMDASRAASARYTKCVCCPAVSHPCEHTIPPPLFQRASFMHVSAYAISTTSLLS